MYLEFIKDVRPGKLHIIILLLFLMFASGVKIMYLPAYSPDLNPIEEAFSWVKGYICRHGKQFLEAVTSKEDGLLFMFLYEALDCITPELVQSWMHHSGYM